MKVVVIILLSLMTGVCSFAQRNKRASKQPVDTVGVRERIQDAYSKLELDKAKEELEKLSKALKNQTSAEITQIKERIERAERMLSRTEKVQLLGKYHLHWEDVQSTLIRLSPTLGKQIEISVLPNGQPKGSFMAEIGGYRFKITSEDDNQLIRIDYPHNSRAHAEPLSESINQPKEEPKGFPYVLSDGIRLIFSKKASSGLGGYDLFLSRYNWEKGSYLEPSPIGMPFNSLGNDFLLAYDDEQDRSYLLSDRDCQGAGTVHLYVFKGLPRTVAEAGERKDSLEEMTAEERLMHARLDDSIILKEHTQTRRVGK